MNRSLNACLVRLCLVAALAWGMALDAAGAKRPILLRNQIIDTSPAAGAAKAAAVEAPRPGLLLVQFDGPLQPQWREHLRRLNVELLHYVPEDAFLVRSRDLSAADLRALAFVSWSGSYRPSHKMHGALQLPPANGRSHAVAILLAADTRPEDRPTLRRQLEEVQSESDYPSGAILRGRASSLQLERLAASDHVLWIEPQPQMRLNDEAASRIVAGEGSSLGRTSMMDLGYDGTGVTVAVADSGLDTGETSSLHPDLADRVKAFFFYGSLTNAEDWHGHGTHCAGIVAGNGAMGETDENGYFYGLGVAPGASLVAQRMFDGAGGYQPPSSFAKLTRDATRAGADIGSNSWGDDTQGRYDLSAREFDILVRDADDLKQGDQPYILEFSAGNAGPGSRTVGSPAVAKNVIATGASENNRFNLPIEEFTIYSEGQDAMADFSSRGPCEDGRIKPDVVAPGTWIASLRSLFANDDYAWWPISDNYFYEGGTSQAGPHVSGAAAVFVQFYRAAHTNATPSPALVKAALINSATDMTDGGWTDPVPSMDQGWGRVNLPALIGSVRNHEFLDQTVLLTNGQQFEQRVMVGSPDEPLKITLAYTDRPGLPAAVPALVNDLDLEVLGPDGRVYHGNQFEDGESLPDLLATDTINNVEAVHLYAPVPGDYLIRVKAARVVEDSRKDTPDIDQDFALVISAAIATPGLGIVTFDKPVYRAPDVIKLRLTDTDLAGQPSATLLLRSTLEPAGETIVLQASGPSGSFTASVATVTGPALPDGQLQVADGDTLEALYEDAHPAAPRVFAAKVDLLPPAILNVTATAHFGQIVISWDTDEFATAIVRYGTNTLNLSVTNRTLDLQHEILLTNVVANCVYQFLVISADEAGNLVTNDNGGLYFTFTLVTPPPVLLVDSFSDLFPELVSVPPLSGYTEALDQLGTAYDVFDATLNPDDYTQTLPTLTQLMAYRCVIWRIPDYDFFETPSPALANDLTSYVQSGGSLLVASMEATSQFQKAGVPQFNTNVLQVGAYSPDQPVNSITGTAGDPLGAGISTDLDYTPYEEILLLVEDPSDWITPTTNATSFLSSDTHMVGIRSPKPGRDMPGRVVFLSFPLDAVPMSEGTGNNRAGLLRNILNFLIPPQGLSTLALDSDVYSVPGRAVAEVENLAVAGSGQAVVSFSGPHQPDGVSLVLTETTRPGLFRGTVSIMPTYSGAPGLLVAQSGDTILADYLDPSSGQVVSTTATIETNPPAISGVGVEPGYLNALVYWDTSEATDALVQYTDIPFTFPINFTAYDPNLDTYHELLLQDLQPNHTYYYQVVSRDRAGNTTVDDNGGVLYQFTTLLPLTPPWTDNMESAGSGWEVQTDPEIESQLEWALGVPGDGAGAHSPDQAWGSNLQSLPADWGESFLITPAIHLTGGNHAALGFWHRGDFSGDGVTSLELGEVLIYLSGSEQLISLETFDSYATDWEWLEYDLTQFVGEVVHVVWHYALFAGEDYDDTGWFIDDVSVTTSYVPTGVILITNNLSQAFFELGGPTNLAGQGTWLAVTGAPPGQYVLEFGDVPFYQTPPSQTNTLDPAGVLVCTGNYTFPDANLNGISDLWEQHYFGSVVSNRWQFADWDRDGANTYTEFMAGTDPLNRASFPQLTPLSAKGQGVLCLGWQAVAGRTYRVAASDDFQAWDGLTAWQAWPPGPASACVTNPPDGLARFFHLEVDYPGADAEAYERWLDWDHDGSPDYAEFIAGTDPTNNASLLNLGAPEALARGSWQFHWLAAAGRSYRILGSTDLQEWTPLNDWRRETGGLTWRTLALPPNQPQRFFRLEVLP